MSSHTLFNLCNFGKIVKKKKIKTSKNLKSIINQASNNQTVEVKNEETEIYA